MNQYLRTDAVFSDCMNYRYRLYRTWEVGPMMAVIGLNPSTADETQDDPTIRRCVGFAKDLGCGGLCMLNLFALRSTDPKVLYSHHDPVGSDNDQHIADVVNECWPVVAAWGVHGALQERGAAVLKMYYPFYCWGKTKAGHPSHPLYLPKTSKLVRVRNGC